MADRPAKPADMPWLSPYLMVKDPEASIDFYKRAFGFALKAQMPGPGGKIMHAEMRYKDALIMFGPEGAFGGTAMSPKSSGVESPIGLYLYVEDVDAFYNQATAAGAREVMPPADMFYGDRVCKVLDLDGHPWNFATNVADFDPSKAPH